MLENAPWKLWEHETITLVGPAPAANLPSHRGEQRPRNGGLRWLRLLASAIVEGVLARAGRSLAYARPYRPKRARSLASRL